MNCSISSNNTASSELANLIRIKTIEIVKLDNNILIRKIKLNKKIFNSFINKIKQELTSATIALLHKIGMKDNLSGYYYFIDSILYALIKDSFRDRKYMYHIYEYSKKNYNKSIKTIEREMRYAKEISWKYNSDIFIEKILGYPFNYKHDYPTNMELIIALKECIRTTIGY